MRLPLFWQLEVPLFRACKSVGAFVYVCDPDNMPVTRVALQYASIDTVVTTYDDALALSNHLTERQLSGPRHWFIVRRPDQEEKLPESISKDAFEETHNSPGILKTTV